VLSLAANGLPPKKAVKATYREAFQRWLETIRKNRAIDRLPELDGFPHLAIFQFTKNALEEGEYQYATETKIVLDTTTGKVTCRDNATLAQYAQSMVNQFLEEKTADYINTLVKHLVDDATTMNSMNLSPRAYSFSADFADLATKVHNFLLDIGCRSKLFSLARDARTEQSLAEVAIEKATRLMDALDERVNSWEQGTTAKSVSNQAERFVAAKREVESHAALFKGLYQEMVDRINKSCAKMMQRAQELGIVNKK
jgi:hypothetical protein